MIYTVTKHAEERFQERFNMNNVKRGMKIDMKKVNAVKVSSFIAPNGENCDLWVAPLKNDKKVVFAVNHKAAIIATVMSEGPKVDMCVAKYNKIVAKRAA